MRVRRSPVALRPPARLGVPGSVFTLITALFGIVAATSVAAAAETRALWVLSASLTSAERVASVVRAAGDNGFNTLLVQVRARGDAFYLGGSEPPGAAFDPAFDPLATLIDLAHRRQLSVHAWVNVNFVASATYLPSDPRHVVRAHPEWIMVPRGAVGSLAGLHPTEPGYVERLASWVRTHDRTAEGLYTSPLVPEAADYVVDVIGDLVARYPLDGVHLDYIRFPSAEYDYGRLALEAFRRSVDPELDAGTRATLATRRAGDPLIDTRQFPERWAAFRRDRLTALVARVRATVHARRTGAVLSASAVPDASEAFDHRLQDWQRWVAEGLLDALCPMVYTTDPDAYRAELAALADRVHDTRIWVGIGAYRLTARETVTRIGVARRHGVDGIVLFSYDSLVERSADYLPAVGRAAFGATIEAARSDR